MWPSPWLSWAYITAVRTRSAMAVREQRPQRGGDAVERLGGLEQRRHRRRSMLAKLHHLAGQARGGQRFLGQRSAPAALREQRRAQRLFPASGTARDDERDPAERDCLGNAVVAATADHDASRSHERVGVEGL